MKALLWDFDGTLATRNGMWTGTLVAAPSRIIHLEPLPSCAGSRRTNYCAAALHDQRAAEQEHALPVVTQKGVARMKSIELTGEMRVTIAATKDQKEIHQCFPCEMYLQP